ncbi:MAG: ATP-binding protein [Ktedonobacteraceae bacterium]|nr:ATP-binding protein [Ktedonobacteraceae bacterium]
MFGFPRLIALLGSYPGDPSPITYLRNELARFTGDNWEQEDDITLVTLQRLPVQAVPAFWTAGTFEAQNDDTTRHSDSLPQRPAPVPDDWRVLHTWSIPSEIGNERLAITYVAEAVNPFSLTEQRIERLKTAVAEATMNAMEHGNRYNAEVPVQVEMLSSEHAIAIRISDQGDQQPIKIPEAPAIEAKLAGTQSPRGWGLFLIQHMVDDMRILSGERFHTIELIMHLEGDSHVQQNV